jgi:hypothetical protein
MQAALHGMKTAKYLVDDDDDDDDDGDDDGDNDDAFEDEL